MSESRQRGGAGADAAAELLGLLGLSEDELCRVLDADPLTLLSGQLDHRPELPILLELLRRARGADRRGPSRALGASPSVRQGRPIDALARARTSACSRTRSRAGRRAASCCAAVEGGDG